MLLVFHLVLSFVYISVLTPGKNLSPIVLRVQCTELIQICFRLLINRCHSKRRQHKGDGCQKLRQDGGLLDM